MSNQVDTNRSGEILTRLKSLYPKSIDLTLNRPKRLLADLDHPERHLPPVIHFAGTNGKGSTLAMVRAGLEASGQRVHSYISPHLTRFNERITLAGEIIEERALVDALLECEAVNRGKAISLFEITTAAAMLAFSRTEADTLLLEVGLGGRLDATNVVDRPKLTVITPVSLDHEQYLGNRLEQIAAEKAGILKAGVPCVVSRQRREAMDVIEKHAARVGSQLLVQDRDWSAEIINGKLLYRDCDGRIQLPVPNLVGAHQAQNAGAALTVLKLAGLEKGALSSAVSEANWPGRMQRLNRGPLVRAARDAELWLDGGHNPAAGAALSDTLRSMPGKTTQVICGMLNTKDVRGFLRALRSAAGTLYGIAIPNEQSSLTAEQVAEAAREVGFWTGTSTSVESAAASITKHDSNARILVCGSLYLAGHVLKENH